MSKFDYQSLLSPFGWENRYEVLERIGSGAMGQVWQAREIATDRIVALKMLDPARTGDEGMLARLEIEGETLTKLRDAGQHEHVVPILDFQVTDAHACLVMEFIPGLNLKRWCSAHQLALMDRVRLIAQAARASGWFHHLGVVHRDLKPANILVHAVSHEPVIVDFSIAKQEEGVALTMTNEALGTAPFMAPEQFDPRRGPITPATDVFALGSTLYELMTEVHPHPGDFPQIMQRHSDEVRPAPPSALNPAVPRDLECICLKALSHRPADRYADGKALAEDLERFLAGEPVRARPISVVTRLVRKVRRKPALAAALAACLLLGIFAIWNVQRQAAQRARFDLETQIATAMQEEEWCEICLTSWESALSSMARHDATLANALRQRLHIDVVHDVESRLQKPHLKEADFTWLHSTTEWLEARLPEQATHLQSLITSRLGRWETLAELSPPFADLHRLFPRSHVRPDSGRLHAVHDEPNRSPPPILVTDGASVPMEIDCTFKAERSSFHHIALDFAHQNAYLVLLLYKVGLTPNSAKKSLGLESADPESYVLYFSHNRSFLQGIHIPDIHLLDRPFRMTLRVERDWAEGTINGRWPLRLDSPFALGSVQPANHVRIFWPSEIGLEHLALRNRRSDSVSPLEEADLLMAQGRWPEARRLYENLRGDPFFGVEADSKIAQCLYREGDDSAAAAIGEQVIQGKPSEWRDRCLIQLWLYSYQHHDSAAASRYAALLPSHLTSDTLKHMDPVVMRELSETLVFLSMGLARPRQDPALLRQASQIYRLLKTPPLLLANRLGMAHHFAHLDQEARELYVTGLNDLANVNEFKDGLTAATNCLDQWCRLTPSETEPLLADRLIKWKNHLKGGETIQAVWHMEQARRSGRAKKYREAIGFIREARKGSPENLDNRVHTSIWLLEGMLFHLEGAEDKAKQAWQKAQEVAATVTRKHPLHLFDSVMIQSLAQSWNLKTAGDVMTHLAGRHLRGAESSTAQGAFNQTFLSDPAWLTTFNSVLRGERGRKFAEDYVLCREPPRDLVQRYYRLIFEYHFLSTAFPHATSEQVSRVRQIVDQLVSEMSMNPRGELAHLHDYLRAWNDRATAKSFCEKEYPYDPALIENMKWLLKQRQP